MDAHHFDALATGEAVGFQGIVSLGGPEERGQPVCILEVVELHPAGQVVFFHELAGKQLGAFQPGGRFLGANRGDAQFLQFVANPQGLWGRRGR